MDRKRKSKECVLSAQLDDDDDDDDERLNQMHYVTVKMSTEFFQVFVYSQ